MFCRTFKGLLPATPWPLWCEASDFGLEEGRRRGKGKGRREEESYLINDAGQGRAGRGWNCFAGGVVARRLMRTVVLPAGPGCLDAACRHKRGFSKNSQRLARLCDLIRREQ